MTKTQLEFDVREENLSRWQLDFQTQERAYLKANQGQKRSPILDVTYERNFGVQVGLNVPHIKHDPPGFTNLRQGFEKMISYMKREPLIIAEKIFLATLEVIFKDPSISKFSFSKLNSFNIHLTDPFLIGLLEQEQKTHNQRRIYSRLHRDNSLAQQALFGSICENPENYCLALSLIDEEKRQEFYNQMRELAKRRLEANKIASKSRDSLTAIRDHIKILDELGVNVAGIEQAIDNVSRKSEHGGLLTLEQLTELHYKFMERPYSTQLNIPKISYFSDVWRLPTTLHERANSKYSLDIVTFKVTEPFFNVAFREGELSKGYLTREKLVGFGLWKSEDDSKGSQD